MTMHIEVYAANIGADVIHSILHIEMCAVIVQERVRNERHVSWTSRPQRL